STFRHTLNLFKEGKAEDCLIGCDFILKMDPRFAPARQLMEKAKNPASDVDVAHLEELVVETPTRLERIASPETDRLLVRAAESLNARDFDAAVAAAEQVLQALPGNKDATEILRKAREKKNAQPQFEIARQRAIAALEGHRDGEARAALEKMKSLDPEHPAVALLDRKLAAAAPPPAAELGESTNPGLRLQEEEPAPVSGGGSLGDLSLDSLSLDESSAAVPPPPDMGRSTTGPLAIPGRDRFTSPSVDASPAPDLWNSPPEGGDLGSLSLEDPSPAVDLSAAAYSSSPAYTDVPEPVFSSPMESAPEPPSQHQEIASLLQRGDEAARSGNRQQAIEIWSRIFLIDINNSDAVGRIEKARQEMSEGNKRVADGLKRGREAFEAGDFSTAREAFLQVLAVDETDLTARSYLDRIEAELARPSSGLDLAKKAPQSDILSEEMAVATASEPEPEARTPVAAPERDPTAKVRKPADRRFVLALAAAVVLAVGVGGYMLLRPGHGKAAPRGAAEGGPSLEHATALFQEGKLTETVAELRQIAPSSPDYARAQKLLASLTRKGDAAAGASAPADGSAPAGDRGEAGAPAASTGPAPEALRQRQEAEKAFAEKRYIESLTAFNLAAPAFQSDPSFTQSLGAAAEKVSELTPAVKLYNEGEYETAIPILWRIFQADRENQDARSYLLRSYYNQGIGQLQNGLYAKAADSFKEVLSIDPSDADAIRHAKFANRYAKGDLDLMGRIYVRHVQQRP
ncbi:MAG TPA: tetratricopeptide repeat protein, partial [Thermoanaerobaculia bacterium]|nr:tetratricopeptide repeat protein [Thermoanaerobaculia bacterium]